MYAQHSDSQQPLGVSAEDGRFFLIREGKCADMPQLGLRVCPRAVCAEQDALCAERADEVHERFIRKPLGIVLRRVRRTEREGRVQQSRGIRK